MSRAFRIGAVWIGFAACLALAAPPQPGGFRQLPMEAGKPTAVGSYSLQLSEPDNADKPTIWQGPLAITSGGASCTADVSLVTSVYAAPDRSFAVVITSSGSNFLAHFVDLGSCAPRWPAIKRAASGVTVAGKRLSFLPACEGEAHNAPALCTSARVYRLDADRPPAYLKSESYRLTAKALGVGFTGEARVMDPRTAKAILVP